MKFCWCALQVGMFLEIGGLCTKRTTSTSAGSAVGVPSVISMTGVSLVCDCHFKVATAAT